MGRNVILYQFLTALSALIGLGVVVMCCLIAQKTGITMAQLPICYSWIYYPNYLKCLHAIEQEMSCLKTTLAAGGLASVGGLLQMCHALIMVMKVKMAPRWWIKIHKFVILLTIIGLALSIQVKNIYLMGLNGGDLLFSVVGSLLIYCVVYEEPTKDKALFIPSKRRCMVCHFVVPTSADKSTSSDDTHVDINAPTIKMQENVTQGGKKVKALAQ